MSDDRLAQARAEAERRWPRKQSPDDPYPASRYRRTTMDRRIGFEQGVKWADAHPYSTPEELVAAYEDGQRDAVSKGVATPWPVDGSTSDGHHTFDELYEYRMLYNAHAAHGWLAAGIPVVKSWRHADGEECFGGGWFIVTATLPAGQVSNHYEAKHWGLFKVPEVDVPPEWDGHTPHDAAMRLRIEAEHANPQPRTITRAEFLEALEAHVDVGSSGDWVTVEDMLMAAFIAVGIEVVDDE